MPRPLLALLAAAAVVLSACGASSPEDTRAAGDADTSGSTANPQDAPDPDDTGRCTLTTDLAGGDVAAAPAAFDLPWPWEVGPERIATVEGFDVNRILRGGPPPDGIRPLEVDEVCFDHVEAADTWLADDSPVLVVEVGTEARVYPIAIMTQHEIANDVIDGLPVVVTYCPLCNSGLAFERTVDGEVLTFGTSGRLFQSNLVMYDRQHRNLWSQFAGEALVGTVDEDLTGTHLVRIPTALLGWSEVRETLPDALVLSPQVSPARDYGRNPYPGYDDIGIDYGLFLGDTDARMEPNVRVVGLGADLDPIAIPLELLAERGTLTIDLDGTPVSVWWAPGASSALDGTQTHGGRDVGQTVSFEALAPDGTALTFHVADDDATQFVDDQTGSRWSLLGEAIGGPLAGTRLPAVARDDTFWFVWFAFQPDTAIVQP